jgi:hypothetical protein
MGHQCACFLMMQLVIGIVDALLSHDVCESAFHYDLLTSSQLLTVVRSCLAEIKRVVADPKKSGSQTSVVDSDLFVTLLQCASRAASFVAAAGGPPLCLNADDLLVLIRHFYDLLGSSNVFQLLFPSSHTNVQSPVGNFERIHTDILKQSSSRFEQLVDPLVSVLSSMAVTTDSNRLSVLLWSLSLGQILAARRECWSS